MASSSNSIENYGIIMAEHYEKVLHNANISTEHLIELIDFLDAIRAFYLKNNQTWIAEYPSYKIEMLAEMLEDRGIEENHKPHKGSLVVKSHGIRAMELVIQYQNSMIGRAVYLTAKELEDVKIFLTIVIDFFGKIRQEYMTGALHPILMLVTTSYNVTKSINSVKHLKFHDTTTGNPYSRS